MKKLLLIFVVLNLIVVPLTISAQSNNFEVKVENGATATPITNGYYIDGVDNSGESAGVVYTKAAYKTYIFETKIKPIKCWGEIMVSQCSFIEDGGIVPTKPSDGTWNHAPKANLMFYYNGIYYLYFSLTDNSGGGLINFDKSYYDWRNKTFYYKVVRNSTTIRYTLREDDENGTIIFDHTKNISDIRYGDDPDYFVMGERGNTHQGPPGGTGWYFGDFEVWDYSIVGKMSTRSDWKLPVNITNGTSTFNLTIGESYSATDDYDISIDTIAAPPGPSFYAYINSCLPSPYTCLSHSIKDSSSENVWDINITNTDGKQITISWDKTKVPAYRTITLCDGASIDMSLASSYRFTGDRSFQIKAAPSVEVTQSISLREGWNLISLGVIPEDNSVVVLFPDALAVYTWDSMNQKYCIPSTIECGYGYWIAAENDETVTVTGKKCPGWSRQVHTGWSLIGALSEDKPVSNLSSGSEDPVIFGYDFSTGHYYEAHTLEAGKGYWVGVKNYTEIVLGESNNSGRRIVRNQHKVTDFLNQFSLYPPLPPDYFSSRNMESEKDENIKIYNTPNPFNTTTYICVKLPEAKTVNVKIYNILGQLIKKIFDGRSQKGVNRYLWDGKDKNGKIVSSGLYIVIVTMDAKRYTGKMLFLK